jgi:hypothetical protein
MLGVVIQGSPVIPRSVPVIPPLCQHSSGMHSRCSSRYVGQAARIATRPNYGIDSCISIFSVSVALLWEALPCWLGSLAIR